MANPITWQNVQSRDNNGAAALLEGARRSINDGMSAFKGEIDNAEAIIGQNYATQGKNNTQSYLDALSQYRTVGDLEGGRGQLDTLAASLGPNIDKNVLRTGFDERLGALRTDAAQDYAYKQTELDQQANPLLEQIRSLMVTDPGAAQALTNENKAFLAETGDFAALTAENANQTEVLKRQSNASTDRLTQLNDQQIARDRAAESHNNSRVLNQFDEMDRVGKYVVGEQNKYMDEVLGKAIANNPESGAQLGQEMHDAAIAAGMSETIAGDYGRRAREAFTARFEIDNEQNALVDAAKRAADITYQGRTAVLNRTMAKAQRDYPVDEVYTYNPNNALQQENAVVLATKNNWDADNTPNRITKVKNAFLKEYPAILTNESTEAFNLIGTFLTRAVGNYGSYDGLNLFGLGNEMDDDRLLALVKDEYTAYLKNTSNKDKLDVAQRVFDTDSAQAMLDAQSGPADMLTDFAAKNRERAIGISRTPPPSN